MNVLQVNNIDLAGRRFNGYDLNCQLKRQGHQTHMMVLRKHSDDKNVEQLSICGKLYQAFADRASYFCSAPGAISPYGRKLRKMTVFRQADVVHYHLIHNNVVSVKDMLRLSTEKPTIWTWHDPWAITGHCVHPKGCTGWKTGCSPCPHLDEYFPLKTDCAGRLWQQKLEIYRQMDADIVVSSDFMLDFAKNSPLGQCFPRVHKIPFGIQIENFGQHTREDAREKLGIPPGHFVIAYRCEMNPYKGCSYVHDALDRMEERENVTILSIGAAQIPHQIKKKFHCVDLGWQDDPMLLADFYSACDVFLMPSIAESFGLMAVEAIASRRPVICFEGTALPAVTFAPECGIAVPKGDTDGLLQAILCLRECPEQARKRGELGLKLAQEHYRFEDYVRRHFELYEDVIARRKFETGKQIGN